MMTLLGNKGKAPLYSPFVNHYCLTLTTALLAAGGFIGALFAALSCEFLYVQLDELPRSSAAAVSWIEGFDQANGTDVWYYNELSERSADQRVSSGIFCPIPITRDDDGRLKLAKAFFVTSLLFGALLLNLTCLISVILPNSARIWNGISLLAGLGFLCELPVFFVLDSQMCTGDFTCSLGGGSFGFFCSMACYLMLAFLTQAKEAPEWREEYELWKLRRQNLSDRGGCDAQRDLEMGLGTFGDGVIGDQDMKREHSEEVPHPPPPPPITHEVSPQPKNERRLAKQARTSETSNFVGTYISVTHEQTTPDRGTTKERNNISPITLCTLSKDASSAVETGAETEVHKNTQVSHDILNSSMDLINQQLQKTLELKRNLRDKKRQRDEEEQMKQKQIEDISHLSFLDYTELDANVSSFQQAPFGKDSFDHAFYADMPDLSSIIVSNDEDDAPNLSPPVKQLTRACSKLAPLKEAAVEPSHVIDDASVPKSLPSVSTRSTLGRSVKSIFRKKENKLQSRGGTENKEMIQEQWMLDEASVGRSNSDDLLFLIERNKEDGASQTSRRSKVVMLSWASRCRSPDKRKTHSRGAAIVSPTHLPSEITAVQNIARGTDINVVSPEKDDPGVEMYPSDASMSTLSLPTASDYYTSEDDRRSRSSRKDGNSYHRGISSGTDSETEEMSIIIAGVQRMNRKTCGKPSHLSKKRRRRRKKGSRSGCSISEYSSHSGSLLDEVIDEEGELNESGEPIPAVIDASPNRAPKNKSKSPKKSVLNREHLLSDAESGYESGYAYRSDFSDDESKKTGYHVLSENEESTSSRAARARMNRLLSKRQIHIDPDSIPSDPADPYRDAIDEPGYKSPTNSHYSGRSYCEDPSCQIPSRPLPAYPDIVPMSKNSNMEGCFGSTSQRGNMSWQARNSRMKRLRMQRQAADSVVRESNVMACGSDEGSI